MTDEDIIRAHYRWWTVSASRDHLKLGPIAFAVYPLDWWCVDVIWLCRYRLATLPLVKCRPGRAGRPFHNP